MRIPLIWLSLLTACGPASTSPAPIARPIESYFPLASATDAQLCRALAKRPSITTGFPDRSRRKVIVSDLHLGPGVGQGRAFDGLEDFFADDAFARFLERLSKRPTELIVAGDFVEFWQIEEALALLPKRDGDDPVLATDQAGSLAAFDVARAAHPMVFAALSTFLDSGDHRLVFVVGNHDGDLVWPRVQLALARALGQRNLNKLRFAAAGYRDRGVHVEHGHVLDAANRSSPAVLDAEGRCRLSASWGQVFVAKFLGELEQRYPFIDNLYPESAAVLWGVSAEPDVTEPMIAGYRFLDMLLSAQSSSLNLEALRASALSLFGAPDSPESSGDRWATVWDRMPSSSIIWSALSVLASNTEFAPLRRQLAGAVALLPDTGAAASALGNIDLTLLSRLKDRLTKNPLALAATELIAAAPEIRVVVYGHTHVLGGSAQAVEGGHYANSGTWTPIGDIADLKQRGVRWPQLSVDNFDQFPRRLPAVVIDYEGENPRPPHIVYAE